MAYFLNAQTLVQPTKSSKNNLANNCQSTV